MGVVGVVGVVGMPHNISVLVVFLASDESAFIAAQEFVVDGGMSMLPAPHQRPGPSRSKLACSHP